MEAIFLDCGACGPQLKRNPLGSATKSPNHVPRRDATPPLVKSNVDDRAATMKDALLRTRVPMLLSSRPAFVLERIARGGGATDWYSCAGPQDLDPLSRKLRPGSRVTFYFAISMARSRLDALPREELSSCIATSGDALVLVPRRFTIDVRSFLVNSPEELDLEFADLDPDTEVLFGPYPGLDNNGVDTVTLDLPDSDGIVRPHPH